MEYIIMADGNTKYEHKSVFGSTQYIQGANRDVLEIRFPADSDVNEIISTFKNTDQTEEFTIVNEGTEEWQGSEALKTHYTIFVSGGVKGEEVVSKNGEIKEPEYNEYVFVQVAQKTYAEIQQDKLAKRLAEIEKMLSGKGE